MADLTSRRRFLSLVLLGAAGSAGVALGIPFLGYLLGPLIKPARPAWRDVGAVDSFRVGETVGITYMDPFTVAWSGKETTEKAWVRRSGDSDFIAFSVHCTHLGCPVTWEPDAELFLCPCHGGVFDARGEVAGGPPPRPLWRLKTRIRQGRVEVESQRLPVA